MFDSLQSYYRTARDDIRYQSATVLLWRVLVKLLSPLVRLDLQLLFELDLRKPIPRPSARVPCHVVEAGERDIDQILDMQMQVRPLHETPQMDDEEELQHARLLRMRATAYQNYLTAMRAGERCFVAYVDGVMAHSNWIRFHDCGPTDTCALALEPGDVYTTDAYTARAHRGLGLHEVVLTHMLRVAQQRACHRAFTITDLTKAGSRRGVRRVGWRRRGSILYVTPRGVQRTWLIRLGGDLSPLFNYARATAAGTPN